MRVCVCLLAFGLSIRGCLYLPEQTSSVSICIPPSFAIRPKSRVSGENAKNASHSSACLSKETLAESQSEVTFLGRRCVMCWLSHFCLTITYLLTFFAVISLSPPISRVIRCTCKLGPFKKNSPPAGISSKDLTNVPRINRLSRTKTAHGFTISCHFRVHFWRDFLSLPSLASHRLLRSERKVHYISVGDFQGSNLSLSLGLVFLLAFLI